MSQQYQKQKEKWFEKAKQQTLKDELKFLKQPHIVCNNLDIKKRIKQIEKELGVGK